MRKKLVIGNWKMNGSLQANAALIHGLQPLASVAGKMDVGVCPPYPYLLQVSELLRGSSVNVGAQDLAADVNGAFTGDVSGNMLADLGCAYVLIGHSERRSYHAESDDLVAKKVSRALDAGLLPVVCVGETLAERELGEHFTVVTEQVRAAIGRELVRFASASVIAYEPVWAIGTGKTPTAEQVQEVHACIRKVLNELMPANQVRILYGGSVKASNARELLNLPDVDGGLIGGAALVAADFVQICESALVGE